MNCIMTICTDRKCKQWFTIIRMMILFCSFESAHKTSTTIRRVKFACNNGIAYSISSFVAIGMTKVINFLANHYDLFRHNRFLNKRFCLEPVAAQTAVGSTYYKIQR